MSASSSAPNVDLVLVIDSSSSMGPYIDGLRKHLRELLKPMQGHVGRVRFGLVALGAGGNGSFKPRTLVGGRESVVGLYRGHGAQMPYFTEDTDRVTRELDAISVGGDEHSLLALDIALDHPFGSAGDTKRVIAMFSDEPIEGGIDGDAPVALIPKIIDKIHRRRVKLFFVMPESEAALELAQANGSEYEPVADGDALGDVDLAALLGQMGKSISIASLQAGLTDDRPAPLFGQDRWPT